jgi:Ca-activated chloride channel family protein
MVRSVFRARVAVASALVVGAITSACSQSATSTFPPKYQPPQYARPTAAATAIGAYPGQTTQPQWPAPRWTPVPPPIGGWPTAGATALPYPGNNFQDPGVNPFENPNRDPFSTFAMDVDTASYAVARRYIEDGNLPDRSSVRLEEFVNAFDYGYAQPQSGAFAINVDGAPTPFVGSRSLLLRVGIQARSVPEAYRKPVALTFVIDTSGSMADGQRLETVKRSLGLLLSRLRPDDTIAVVRFGNDASVVVNPTSAANAQQIMGAINQLEPDGSTNAQAGLELGFSLASDMLRPGTTDRVIIASDGVANVGLTDAHALLDELDRQVQSGIDLVSIGVGMGNFNDALLEQLADRGNGFYAYINDQQEADQVFGTRLVGTLDTVAKDARVQVEFNPSAVAAYRLLGYEDRAMPDSDFSNPAADAGEVGAGHAVTALYEIEPTWTGQPILGQVSLHWIDPDSNARLALTHDIAMTDFASDYFQATPGFRLAAAVGAFAETLRQSPYATGYTLNDVAREATSLMSSFGDSAGVIEFAHLAQAAAAMNDGQISDW